MQPPSILTTTMSILRQTLFTTRLIHATIKQNLSSRHHVRSPTSAHTIQQPRCCSHNSVADKYVLGIETSCDDTGAAVVDNKGNIIGEALDSQTKIHNATGGIIPTVAKELHKENVERIVSEALLDANMTIDEMDAIAITVEPGLIMSLRVGMEYAVSLAKSSGKPLIPIHHMQAHALTARMVEKVDFPFLVLLASGGHCLLAVAKDIDDFVILGSTVDVSPGDAIDKVGRFLSIYSMVAFFMIACPISHVSFHETGKYIFARVIYF